MSKTSASFGSPKSNELGDDDDALRANRTPAEDSNQESTLLEGLDELAQAMGYGTIDLEKESDGIVEPVVPIGTSLKSVLHHTSAVQTIPGHHRHPSETIAEAFVDELEDVDQTDNLFLDMALTRGLSILPEDIVHAAEATAPTDETTMITSTITEQKQDSESQPLMPVATTTQETLPSPPLSAYLGLALAITALSSIGPSLQMQERVDPVMKVFWSMNATALVLLPFAVRSVWNDGGLPKLTPWQLVCFIFTAAAYATMCTAFVIALNYTAVGNAVILANSQALILLIAKLFVGDQVAMLEGAGALIAFLGAALCSKDSSDAGTSSDIVRTIFGDLIAFIASVAGVFYLILAKSIRPYVSLYLFMFLVMSIGSAIICVYMAATGIKYSFDRDINHGLWGWMNLQVDRLPLEIGMVLLVALLIYI